MSAVVRRGSLLNQSAVPITTAQAPNGALPTLAIPGGGVARVGLGGQRIQNVLAVGSSFATYQDQAGVYFTADPVNVTGVQMRGTNVLFPSADTITLTHTVVNAGHYLTATRTGYAAGTPVLVEDGVYKIYLADGVNYLRVGTYSRGFAAGTVSDVFTFSSRQLTYTNGAVMRAFDAITNRQFNILPDQGVGGNRTDDLVKASRLAQITGCTEISTNDIGNAVNTPTVCAANINTFWTAVTGAGIPVVHFNTPPRAGAYGPHGITGSDPAAATYATVGPKIVETNRRVAKNAATLPNVGVYLADAYSPLVDGLSGKILDYTTQDGLHLYGGGALEYARQLAKITSQISPVVGIYRASGGIAAYDATINPGGNLIVNQRGSFGGSGGTLNTGASIMPLWVASAVVATGAHCIAGDRLYRATVGGTNDTVQPSHTAGVMLDGTTQWTFVMGGVHVLPWAAATAVATAGDIMITSAGIKLACVTPGTTHASVEPTAHTATITDGTVTWALAGTGASAGQAAGWIAGRDIGSALTSAAFRVKAADGGMDWQAFALSGAAVNHLTTTAEAFRYYSGSTPMTLSNLADGDVLDTSIQVKLISGQDCSGFIFDAIYSGYPGAITHGNNAFHECSDAGVRVDGVMTIALPQITWIGAGGATISAVNHRFTVEAKRGGVFYLLMRNYDTHKVT